MIRRPRRIRRKRIVRRPANLRGPVGRVRRSQRANNDSTISVVRAAVAGVVAIAMTAGVVDLVAVALADEVAADFAADYFPGQLNTATFFKRNGMRPKLD